jgi:hypothetical protein
MVLLRRIPILAVLALGALAVACVLQGPPDTAVHRWWGGLGPVLPHDTFPADCKLCHVGEGWHVLSQRFAFDHAAETGYALNGAHGDAQCLRCHNDRGPVAVFAAKGCAGCHEDIHLGQLGGRCTDCHQELTWRPDGQYELHQRTRFPLVGVHAQTACHRCHVGAEVGKFTPTDVECVTCHADDLARAVQPNHVGLGWVERCDRCHMPTVWQAVDPQF